MNPPDRPGRLREDRVDVPGHGGRAKRTAGSAGGDAYQGAFEAVMAVLVGAGLGYWADAHWESTPVGVITGVVVGFAAMVLRLLRLGRELVPESAPEASGPKGASTGSAGSARPSQAGSIVGAAGDDDWDESNAFGDSERGPAEMPVLIDIWRDDASDERDRVDLEGRGEQAKPAGEAGSRSKSGDASRE